MQQEFEPVYCEVLKLEAPVGLTLASRFRAMCHVISEHYFR